MRIHGIVAFAALRKISWRDRIDLTLMRVQDNVEYLIQFVLFNSNVLKSA